MDESESKKLATAWINFQKNWWAWDKLDELCRKDPTGAWPVLLEMVEQAQSKELLEDIGVGPLEDFVNYYAGERIGEIEQGAADSEALRRALAFTQLRDSSDPMAERLEKLGCQVAKPSKQADAFDDL